MEVCDFRDGMYAKIAEKLNENCPLMNLNEYVYKELFSYVSGKNILNLRFVSKGLKKCVDDYLISSRKEITINPKMKKEQVAFICEFFSKVMTLKLKGFTNSSQNRRKSRDFAFIFRRKLPNLRKVHIEHCDCEDLHFMIRELFTNPQLEKLHISHSKLYKEGYNSIDSQLIELSLVVPDTSYLKLLSSTSVLTNAVNLESLEIVVTKQNQVYKGFPFRDLLLRSKRLKKLKLALFIPASDVRFLKGAKIEKFTLSSPNPRLLRKKIPDNIAVYVPMPLYMAMQQLGFGVND
ncbi:hypothetical protein B4U80_12920 [Leptotrombidium deliense]|uniref:F-box domain-containing protein n=1 Tax=Leptotrombidium deliense TaxID=299467 RepID=A0A443SH95_9ACAR|nr:hypothetical protein B4U80_12920 [Leptotrombidium deliense]